MKEKEKRLIGKRNTYVPHGHTQEKRRASIAWGFLLRMGTAKSTRLGSLGDELGYHDRRCLVSLGAEWQNGGPSGTTAPATSSFVAFKVFLALYKVYLRLSWLFSKTQSSTTHGLPHELSIFCVALRRAFPNQASGWVEDRVAHV